MPFDQKLAHRVDEILKNRTGFASKKMFGGVCFLLHGNMACGVINDDLIVRVGPQYYEEALEQPFTRQFDITGKPMRGWVMVANEGHAATEQLRSWVERGTEFALTLPPK